MLLMFYVHTYHTLDTYIHCPQRPIIHIVGVPHIPYTQTCNPCHTHIYRKTHTHTHTAQFTPRSFIPQHPLGPSAVTFKDADDTMLWVACAAVASIPPGLTVIVQQHVLRLEVAVDDASLMQVLQATDDLRCVVDRAGLWEARVLLIHIVDVVPAGRTPREVHTPQDRDSLGLRAHVCQHGVVTLGSSICVLLEKPGLEASESSHLTHDC